MYLFERLQIYNLWMVKYERKGLKVCVFDENLLKNKSHFLDLTKEMAFRLDSRFVWWYQNCNLLITSFALSTFTLLCAKFSNSTTFCKVYCYIPKLYQNEKLLFHSHIKFMISHRFLPKHLPNRNSFCDQ